MSDTNHETQKALETNVGIILVVLGAAIVAAALLVACIPRTDKPDDASLVSLSWALSFLAVGIFFGFLFSVPKSRKNKAKEINVDGSKRPKGLLGVNTNLTEISDWLTKIIVGLGLVELTSIPPRLRNFSNFVSNSIQGTSPNGNHIGLAYSMILIFTTLGFLFGYLLTRLYLSPMFATADHFSTGKALAAESKMISNEEKDKVFTIQVPPVRTERTPDGSKTPEQLLDEQARAYRAVQSPDYRERVRMKDEAAGAMAAIALRNNVDRDWLVNKALTPDDGYVAGLAALINVAPKPGDLERLEKISSVAIWKHARFKIGVALGTVFLNGVSGTNNVIQASSILEKLSHGDMDSSLARQILRAAALISQATGKQVILPQKVLNYRE